MFFLVVTFNDPPKILSLQVESLALPLKLTVSTVAPRGTHFMHPVGESIKPILPPNFTLGGSPFHTILGSYQTGS